MMLIIAAVCLAGLLVGTYTDIRTREVPDWINYGLIFSGFGIAIIYSIVYWNLSYILKSIAGFGLFFIIAYVMYYTGQWGGGDSKMIMGIGALVGISIWPFDISTLYLWYGNLPFLLSFMIYSMIFGAIYGLVWSSVLAYRKRKRFITEFKEKLQDRSIVITKTLLLVIIIAGILGSFLLPSQLRVLVLIALLLAGVTFYLFIFIRAVEKVCMLRYIEPEKLTVGDWIAKEVKVGKEIICGPKDLGIEKKQIERLIELKKKGKVKKVMIKEGIPFVPSFLAAFLISLFLGSTPLFFFF